MNEVDELLLDHFNDIVEHAGVKGMKWGVRKRARIDRTARVGKGNASLLDKARIHTTANPIDLARTRSFKKAASRKAVRMGARNERLATKGEAKVRDYLAEIGTARYTDVLPTVRSDRLSADRRSNLAKMNSGKAFAIALPVAALYVTNKVLKAKQASRAM